MLTFSARYARKVPYCDIARRARRKMQFFLVLPLQSETWIDAPGLQCILLMTTQLNPARFPEAAVYTIYVGFVANNDIALQGHKRRSIHKFGI